MSRKGGATERIPWKVEEIEIMEETPRGELLRLFKANKKLVMYQILKVSHFNRSTLLCELYRLKCDGFVKSSRKPVKLKGETKAKSMAVYEWLK